MEERSWQSYTAVRSCDVGSPIHCFVPWWLEIEIVDASQQLETVKVIVPELPVTKNVLERGVSCLAVDEVVRAVREDIEDTRNRQEGHEAQLWGPVRRIVPLVDIVVQIVVLAVRDGSQSCLAAEPETETDQRLVE